MSDLTLDLQARVQAAQAARTPLQIIGGGTKSFYGRTPFGEPLAVAGHRGIVHYAASELVITARAGTPLAQIEAALAEQQQMLAFEPPHLGAAATLGGTVACGLSGPRRPYAGSARDFVLGMRVLNGRGEVLRFGGEVMKNVAGYDVSRLMVGALGTLGVLLEVSLKVLPQAQASVTLAFELDFAAALARMNAWAAQPLPLRAACCDGTRLYIRLEGTEVGVRAAQAQLGGEGLAQGTDFWRRVRELQHPFFESQAPLWRLSLAPATPMLPLSGSWFIDWGGAQRWLYSDADADAIRACVGKEGGHASLFRGGNRQGLVFQPLGAAEQGLHRGLKDAFDPEGILNRGRLFPNF